MFIRPSSALTGAAVVVAAGIIAGAALASKPGEADHANAEAVTEPGTVNIYSYREPELVEPLLDAFKAKTGIKARIVFAKDGLIERLAAEGRNSPADILLTNDAGLLEQAKSQGVTQPAGTPEIAAAIPEPLRDPEGHWTGLTMRARIVYASKDRVKDEAITYEELASPKWRGRICMRSGQHPYNIALIAAMIAHHGEVETETWLQGLKDNLARKPAGGDREAVRDVAAGLCDIAIGNTYYMAAMLKNPEQKAWADAVRIVLPNSADRGTHVNISGMALTASAPNKANAEKLMAFLVSPEAQRIYADANSEYPANPAIAPSELVKSWGTLKPDALAFAKITGNRKRASELADRVKFDLGPGS